MKVRNVVRNRTHTVESSKLLTFILYTDMMQR